MDIKVVRRNPDDYPYDQFEGFTKLDELEWDNESYQFDITGVWVRDSDGTLWMADDAGCSCPTPWESTDTLERLYSFEPLEDRYRKLTANPDRWGHVNPQEWEQFKATVQAAFEALSKR